MSKFAWPYDSTGRLVVTHDAYRAIVRQRDNYRGALEAIAARPLNVRMAVEIAQGALEMDSPVPNQDAGR